MSTQNAINTTDPIALRVLMNETVFNIVSQNSQQATISEEPLSFTYYGENKRNFLFLTSEKRYDWMSDAAMEAFIKTLGALQLTIADVALLNTARLPEVPSVVDLVAFFKPNLVVMLGESIVWSDLPDLTVLRTYSFDEMIDDAQKKRDFWTKIKTLLI